MAVVALLALLSPQGEDRARAVREAYEEQLRHDRFGPGLTDEKAVLLFFDTREDLATLPATVAVSFLRVWIRAEQVYPALIQELEGAPLRFMSGRVKLLNHLSGRRAPLPNELTRDSVASDWKTWLAN